MASRLNLGGYKCLRLKCGHTECSRSLSKNPLPNPSTQIGIFVRNYQLALVPTTINNLHKKPARKVIAPQQQVTLSHYRRI